MVNIKDLDEGKKTSKEAKKESNDAVSFGGAIVVLVITVSIIMKDPNCFVSLTVAGTLGFLALCCLGSIKFWNRNDDDD